MNTNKKMQWYWYVVLGILFLEVIAFVIFGQDRYIGIHDNLDIHIADYQVMKLNNAFFKYGEKLPILGGLDRNYFLPEWSVYAFLYMVFPNFTAYIIGYFLKILIALFSGILLGRDILKDKYERYEWMVVLGSFTYGLLPLYPAFSLCFASIPLLIYIIRSVVYEKGKRYYFFLFLYPMLSYFTFFGLFIIAYLCVYTIYKSIRLHKVQKKLLVAIVVLSLGYIVMEHRLFIQILFSGEATIRDTMVMNTDSAGTILDNIITAFMQGIFHAADLHQYVILLVCMMYFVVLNVKYIKDKELKSIFCDRFNLVMFYIIFNSIVYGLQGSEMVRSLIATIIPPLKGWQFNRTVFFNPFLWCVAVYIVIMRIYEKNYKKTAMVLSLLVMLIPVCVQSGYNDFFNTVYVNTYNLLKPEKSQNLSYREFYSSGLFEEIKRDICYEDEYSVAYGFHPAVLSYNDISTLDACFSYYSQEYKDKFRRVIAPALDKSVVARDYYDRWGGRAYVYSGTYTDIWEPTRYPKVQSDELMMDIEAFKELGGRYIFSRIDIVNAHELGLELMGKYNNNESPYTIWVWCAN